LKEKGGFSPGKREAAGVLGFLSSEFPKKNWRKLRGFQKREGENILNVQ